MGCLHKESCPELLDYCVLKACIHGWVSINTFDQPSVEKLICVNQKLVDGWLTIDQDVEQVSIKVWMECQPSIGWGSIEGIHQGHWLKVLTHHDACLNLLKSLSVQFFLLLFIKSFACFKQLFSRLTLSWNLIRIWMLIKWLC